MDLAVMVGLTLGAVAAIGIPVLAPSRRARWQGQGTEDLLHRKLAVYRDIKDLELDRDTGKISSEDYELIRADFEKQAVDVMRAMDHVPHGKAGSTREKTDPACAECGEPASPGARFCAACGHALVRVCQKCEAPVGEDDLFCSQCGQRVSSGAGCRVDGGNA